MQQRQPKSWELRKKDPKLYRFFDQTDAVLVKKPGEVSGEQFVMRNCIRCTIYILDHADTIYIDDCVDSRIFLGPTENTIFIRGCKKCKFIMACGQFRSKKCEDIQTLLMCQSQPIIELSLRMGFGCFRGYYPQFAEHLKKAKINRWNNTWSDIFDFNPETQPDIKHNYLLSEDIRYEDMMPWIHKVLPGITAEQELSMDNQVIPFTSEMRIKKFTEEVLVILYPQDSERLNIDSLVRAFQPLQNEAPQQIFAEEPDDVQDIVIDAPEVLYCYLVKAKHQALYTDNYDAFVRAANEHLSPSQASKLLSQIVIERRLQNIFSLHIRTENQDIRLQSYLFSLFAQHNISLRDHCILVSGPEKIQILSELLFANMKDEHQKS